MKYTVNTSRVFAMFASAMAQGITKPIIRLTCDGKPIRLKWWNNRVYINGKQFGEKYGSLLDNVCYIDGGPANLPKLIALLCRDPQRVIAAYGHQSHHTCSFCGRDLSTAESTHVGYGPICAEKFGLPWGHTA